MAKGGKQKRIVAVQAQMVNEMGVDKFLLEKEKREQKENAIEIKVHFTCLEKKKPKIPLNFFLTYT